MVAMLALTLFAVGVASAIGVNPVINNGFYSDLSGTWDIAYGNPDTFSLSNVGALTGTSVHTAPWRDTLNPCLEWFRWGGNQNEARAIGARQTFAAAVNTTGFGSVILTADIWLKGQTTARAFMQVYVNRAGNQMTFTRSIRDPSVPGGVDPSSVVWDPSNPTQTWNVFESGVQAGDLITGVGFGGYGQTFAAQADNIYLGGVPVPEPSGVMAMLTSLSGAAWFIRRRRK
jgi:hypothetical protein